MDEKKLINIDEETVNALMAPVKDYIEFVLSNYVKTVVMNEALSLKADRFKRSLTSEAVFTVNANECKVVSGTPTDLTVTLGSPDEDIESEYRLVFKAGSATTLDVNPPDGFTVLGLEDQTYEEGCLYELSFAVLDSDYIGCICKKWEISV